MKNPTIKSHALYCKWLFGLALMVFILFNLQRVEAQDMGVTTLVTPYSTVCAGTNQTVNVTIKNYDTQTIDYAVNSVTITVNVTGASTQTFSTTISSGTLTAGATQNVTIATTANFSVSGTHIFNANTTLTGDINSSNNSMPVSNVFVDPIPVATATPSSQTICSGTTASIVISSNVSFSTFSPSAVATDVTGAYNMPNQDVLTTTGPNIGTAVYTIYPSANGCMGAPITVTITVNPSPVPTVTSASQSICTGTTTGISLTSNVAGTTFSYTANQANVSGATAGTGATIAQTLTVTNTVSGTVVYTITPLANGCVGDTINNIVTVNPMDDASFSYPSATYCQTGTDPASIITGLQGGTFSSIPVGLAINASTGLISLATSVLGTYTITYTTNGNCPNTSSVIFTITNAPSANYSYGNSSFCQNNTNPLPIFGIGASAGIFSSTPLGVTFTNINTGEIDLSTSTPGTYSIINTIPASGGCAAASYSDAININATDNASFTYTSSLYCVSEPSQTPVVTGLSGIFSASPSSGLVINPSSGEINFANSTVGTYTISYTTNGGCPAISTTTLNIGYTCSSISGYVYKDNDGNCTMGTNDQRIGNMPIRLYDNNNAFLGTCYSSANGFYQFPLTLGTYTVKVDTAAITFNCNNPGIDSTVQLLSGNPPAINVNFAADNCVGFNVGVHSIAIQGIVFPGIQHKIKINAGNMYDWFGFDCNTVGISGQVQVTITGPLTYNGPALGALTPNVTGNTYTYAITDYGTINNLSDFILEFTTNTNAQDVDVICISVSVTSTAGDFNVFDNTRQFCRHVSNSLDPNYKDVYPENVSPGYQDWFTYTIHFQNTGTAAAMNIRLADTLDVNLDFETFEVINYSDTVETALNNNLLTFYFPNIMLPDSASDPEGSKGFVQYRVKPKANLPAGTQIKNTAYIYFDYNAPIVTNTTINEFVLPLSINENKSAVALSVYPNPGNGKYYVKSPEGMKNSEISIKVYNLFGELILTTKMQNSSSQIDLSNQPNGIYIIKVNDLNQSFNQRLIKQK